MIWLRLIEFILVLFVIPLACAAWFLKREFDGMENATDDEHTFTWYVLNAQRAHKIIKFINGGLIALLLGLCLLGGVWLFDHFLGVL